MRTTMFPAHDACAGIYIHIPFCIRKCAYCDFLSAPAGEAVQKAYADQLNRELLQVCDRMKTEEMAISTIYFGGGTPSILPGEQIARLMETLKVYGNILPDAEITLEMNPGTVSREKLKLYRQAGINRLSIGAQSFHDQELKLLGRIHTCEEFMNAYEEARQEGFSNISLDLMSGLPGQTAEQWRENLQRAISLKPEHISAYSLIIEEGTPFYEQYGEDWSEGNEELDRQMYEDTKQILEQAGYLRYEISNYARPGYESRHNTSYWTGVSYYGCGLGASSLVKTEEGWFRTQNETDLEIYLKADAFSWGKTEERTLWSETEKLPSQVETEKLPSQVEIEKLTLQAQMEEFMFLGLRLTRGIDILEFEQRFPQEKSFDAIYGAIVAELVEDGLMEQNGTRIALTERGLDLSNYCFEKFLLD